MLYESANVTNCIIKTSTAYTVNYESNFECLLLVKRSHRDLRSLVTITNKLCHGSPYPIGPLSCPVCHVFL